VVVLLAIAAHGHHVLEAFGQVPQLTVSYHVRLLLSTAHWVPMVPMAHSGDVLSTAHHVGLLTADDGTRLQTPAQRTSILAAT
jgi:hypothetical protein